MTIYSGITTIDDPAGFVNGGTYTETSEADPTSINGGRLVWTPIVNTDPITAINLNRPRRWNWYVFDYEYVSGINTLDGFSNYRSSTFSYTALSESIPQDILDARAFVSTKDRAKLVSVFWEALSTNYLVNDLDKPSYMSLLSGFRLDTRTISNNIVVIPTVTETVTVKYYRENKLESIPGLRSICWHYQTLKAVAGQALSINIQDCVLGTFCCSNALKSAIKSRSISPLRYPLKYLFTDELPDLFDSWNQLYNTANNSNSSTFPETRLIRKLAANNNIWNNSDLTNNIDINVDASHPMFIVDNQRAYNWHVKPQIDGSYGDLVMDSFRTVESRAILEKLSIALNIDLYQVEATPLHKLDYYIQNSSNSKLDEIHTALNAGQYLLEIPADIGTGTIDNPQTPATHKLDWYIKNSSIPTAITDKITAIWKALGGNKYATNIIEATRDKITNLGWFIENIARVNGLRFNDDGDIDLEQERDLYRHKTIENPSLGLASDDGKYNDYSMSCFGKIGMIVPHLPTTYKAGGKSVQLFDVVHDNQQLAIAILRQLDVSLSIQHGSEIRLNGANGKVQAYPNQLAVSLECLQRLEKIGYQTDKNLIVSTVAGTEIRELFSGIGIPVTQKLLLLADPKNSKTELSVPYFGHQKNKPSTAQLLTTVQINLAVINGVLMPKKQPQASIANPFKRFMAPK